MTYDDRASDIHALLWEHAHPALRNMDRDRIAKLAEQILRIATDRGLWTKWSQNREEIAERGDHRETGGQASALTTIDPALLIGIDPLTCFLPTLSW